MPIILNDFSKAALVQAIEANLHAYYAHLRHWPRAEIHDAPDLLWGVTDVPHPLLNMALRARLTPENADPAIATVIRQCQTRHLPLMWGVGPNDRPQDLGGRLLAVGFKHIGGPAGMAADLQTIDESLPGPPALHIQPVEDESSTRTHAAIVTKVFDIPEFVIEAFVDLARYLNATPGRPWRNYLGLLAGEPVATATLFLGAGVAGIYSVATLPRVRGQGIGSALTLAPLLEARAEGYRIGVLHATKMGFPVYQRLGFREYCRIENYLWLPGDGEQAS